MSWLGLVVRYLVFCVFFAVGASAIVLSFLVEPEIREYYQSRAMLEQIFKDIEKLQDLNDQYDSQIALVQREPNILERLGRVTLGPNPVDENTAYPTQYNAQLATLAKRILDSEQAQDPNQTIPTWIVRCNQPRMRSALFLSGAGLIMVAFMFFNGTKIIPLKKGFYRR